MVTPELLSELPSSSKGSFKSMPPIQLQFLTNVDPKTGLNSGRE
jgi:hypothetical protein